MSVGLIHRYILKISKNVPFLVMDSIVGDAKKGKTEIILSSPPL